MENGAARAGAALPRRARGHRRRRLVRLRRGRRDPGPRRARRRGRAGGGGAGAGAAGGGRRPPAASADAGLHRRPHPHAAGAGDRVLGRAAARLAEHLHLPGRGQVRRPGACGAHRRARSSTSCSRHGTTTAVAYCSVHPASADAYLRRRRGPQPAHDRRQGDDGPQRAGGRPRHPAVVLRRHQGADRRAGTAAAGRSTRSRRASRSPRRRRRWRWRRRWSPSTRTCTCRRICRRTATRSTSRSSLYPKARDYLDVYETLRPARAEEPVRPRDPPLRPRDARRWRRPARSRCSARPRTSFSARGLYDKVGLREKGVRRAIATDVGGGTNYSMLRTLDEGYKVLALRGQKLDPLRAFWWITRGNAEALGARRPDRHAGAGLRGRHRGARQRRDAGDGAAGARRSRRWPRSCSCSRRSATTASIAATYVAGERWVPRQA